MIDLPGSHDNSSLRSLIEKPPILGGSFNPITGTMLAGFRLHTGPVSPLMGRPERHGGGFSVYLCSFITYWAEQMMGAGDSLPLLTWTFLWFLQLPEQCRLMHIQPPKKKNKQKHKQSRTQDPVPPGKKWFSSKPENRTFWICFDLPQLKTQSNSLWALDSQILLKEEIDIMWVSWASRTLGQELKHCLQILAGHLKKSGCPWLGVFL